MHQKLRVEEEGLVGVTLHNNITPCVSERKPRRDTKDTMEQENNFTHAEINN